MNKFVKGIVIGTSIVSGVGILSLTYIGLGNIFVEQYHDPENYIRTILQVSRYGWSLKLNDGWAA